MANIKRLLKKKSWTGQELGQIELTNLAEAYKNILAGKRDAPPLIDPAVFTRMVESLPDAEQGHIYNGYISIHDWISIKVNIANTQYQLAQLCLARLDSYIEQAVEVETVFQYIAQLPAIMTQKQYEDTRSERIEAYFKDAEDGEELESNVFNLIERCITYYVRKLQTSPQKANPLKAIRKKYINQPVKSKLILSRWNEKHGEGYYTIEDGSGRRSDQMTGEEWRAAVCSPDVLKVLATMDAEDGQGQELANSIAYKRILNRARVIYNGGTGQDADREQNKDHVPIKWHTYTEPPTDLTKWDVIEQELLLEFYPADIDGSGDEYSESNFTASMKDFYSEFKELVDFALQDMDKKYFKEDEVKAAELPIEQWETTLISWRRLYELDFYGERGEAEADTQIFDGNKRALYNGIAILRPSDLVGESTCIDERGYYVEPTIRNPLSFFTLETFFTDSEDYATCVEIVESAQKRLISAYYYVLGYNAQVDLVSAHYDVPELSVFKLDLQSLVERVNAMDDLIQLLYKQIKDTDYKDKNLQAQKLEVLKDIFTPINIERYNNIPQENIDQAKELFKDFKAFGRERDLFDRLMCKMRNEAGADGEGA